MTHPGKPSFGRDRRRRLNSTQASELYARAGGLCERCGVQLDVTWHQAHLLAYTNGGATTLDDMQAWCRGCNLAQGSNDARTFKSLQLRQWQQSAREPILERLWQTGAATVHAAPGAGKTIFAGTIFGDLYDAKLVERLLVVVPNRALQRQWTDALSAMSVHLDYEPRDGFLEHPKTVGAVVTYQGLSSAIAGHVQTLTDHPTLVVLDEVHHVGEHAAWGRAVSRMAGDSKDSVAAAILNMTGTLFRSSGNARIGTVRYDRVSIENVEKYQAVADFSVPASDLIGIELRRPDLYAYDGEVQLVDLKEEAVIEGEFADLESGPQVNTAIRKSFMEASVVSSFAEEALKLLSQQLSTIEGREPLKMLWVAEDQAAARLAATQIDKVAGRSFARLVISDHKSALQDLRAAARSSESCAIVAVRMVTEGFDCPQVSVIAYASATSAILFIAQTMARAMRVTKIERQDQMLLPAQILIPNNPALRRAFSEALIGHFHILDVPDEKAGQGEDEQSATESGDRIRLPRYELANVANLDLYSATVLGESDGMVLVPELDAARAVCEQLSIPTPYAPRVAVASRRIGSRLPLYSERSPADRVPLPSQRAADPRTLNKVRRTRLKDLAGWMLFHIDHDDRFENIKAFQYKANVAAEISGSRGRENATSEQLAQLEEWMVRRIQEHCGRHGCSTPSVARGIGLE